MRNEDDADNSAPMPKDLIEKSIDHLINHATAILQRHNVVTLILHQPQSPRGLSFKNNKSEMIPPSKNGRSHEFFQG